MGHPNYLGVNGTVSATSTNTDPVPVEQAISTVQPEGTFGLLVDTEHPATSEFSGVRTAARPVRVDDPGHDAPRHATRGTAQHDLIVAAATRVPASRPPDGASGASHRQRRADPGPRHPHSSASHRQPGQPPHRFRLCGPHRPSLRRDRAGSPEPRGTRREAGLQLPGLLRRRQHRHERPPGARRLRHPPARRTRLPARPIEPGLGARRHDALGPAGLERLRDGRPHHATGQHLGRFPLRPPGDVLVRRRRRPALGL